MGTIVTLFPGPTKDEIRRTGACVQSIGAILTYIVMTKVLLLRENCAVIAW